MALIKRCPCGCINDLNEALCRKCGSDILFGTPENIPDDQYEKEILSQHDASEVASSSPAELPERGNDSQNSHSEAGASALDGAGFGEIFDKPKSSEQPPRTPGTGRIVVKPISSQVRPQLFKFCKCGEVNSPNSQICSLCASNLESVAAMTKQQHEKMLEDLKKVQQPETSATVPGKYLRSLDNECVIQPKPMGEKSLIGRSSSDKNVRNYLASRAGVSRNHANFWHDGNNLFIEDIGSTNGTFIDNRRIENNKSYVLKPGNQVSLGNPNGKPENIAVFRVK